MRSCHTSHIFHQCPTKKTLVSSMFRTGSYESPSAALSARAHRMSPNALISSSEEFPDAWWWMNKDMMSLFIHHHGSLGTCKRWNCKSLFKGGAHSWKTGKVAVTRKKLIMCPQRFYLFFRNGRPRDWVGKPQLERWRCCNIHWKVTCCGTW